MNLKDYLKNHEIKYLIDVRDNNSEMHVYNYGFLGAYCTSIKYFRFYIYEKQLPIDKIDYNNEKYHYLYYDGNNIVGRMNFYLNIELYHTHVSFFISYIAFTYVLKKGLEFDIDYLMENRNFINIIQYRFLYIIYESVSRLEKISYCRSAILNNSEMTEEDMLSKRSTEVTVGKAYDIMNLFDEVFEVLYINSDDKPNNVNIEKKEKFKQQLHEAYSSLFNNLLEKYIKNEPHIPENKITKNQISDDELYELSEGLLDNLIHKNVVENKESKSTNETVVEVIQVATGDKKEIEEHYKSIAKLLEQYIINGNPEKYKSIFEDKKLKKGTKRIVFKNANQRELVLFSKVFGLSLMQLKKVAKTMEEKEPKEIEIKDSYFDSNKITKYNDPKGIEEAINKVEIELKKI